MSENERVSMCDNGAIRIDLLQGMTLRDWFAGQALAGLFTPDMDTTWYKHQIAARCFEMADAMLKEGEKPCTPKQ